MMPFQFLYHPSHFEGNLIFIREERTMMWHPNLRYVTKVVQIECPSIISFIRIQIDKTEVKGKSSKVQVHSHSSLDNITYCQAQVQIPKSQSQDQKDLG